MTYVILSYLQIYLYFTHVFAMLFVKGKRVQQIWTKDLKKGTLIEQTRADFLSSLFDLFQRN